MRHGLMLGALICATGVLGCELDSKSGGDDAPMAHGNLGAEDPAGVIPVSAEGYDHLVHVDEETAFENDVAILAKETGWDEEEIRESMRFQARFADYVAAVEARYPDQLAAVWSEPAPAAEGHIVFVDDVPDDVTLAAIKKGDGRIHISGGAELSLAEQAARVREMSRTLVDLGHI